MALSSNLDIKKQEGRILSKPVASGETVYVGAFTAMLSGAATAAARGTFAPFDSDDNYIPMGYSLQSNRTQPGGGIGLTEVRVAVDSAVVLLPVTTAAAGADIGRLVYASDDGTYSLARGVQDAVVGMVVKQISTSESEVLALSASEQAVLAMAGQGVHTYSFIISGVHASGANQVAELTAQFHGRIVGFELYPIQGLQATGDLDVSLRIGATPITGALVNWLDTDDNGEAKQSTAITAANILKEGDSLQVVATVSTASNAGLAQVHVHVLGQPGI